jgi:hypothetical protein
MHQTVAAAVPKAVDMAIEVIVQLERGQNKRKETQNLVRKGGCQ